MNFYKNILKNNKSRLIKMGANCCVLLLLPNTYTSLELSDYVQKNLYEDYLKELKKKDSKLFSTIHFSINYLKELNVSNILAKKIVIELNKLKLKKYSFWNLNNIEYVSLQISYYLFAKLIHENYIFKIKEVKKDVLGIGYKIDSDFEQIKIDEFKTMFFSDKDNNVIDIDTNEDKYIHDSLNYKLANKLYSIISELDVSIIIPTIITSLQNKIQEEEEHKNNV